MDLSIIIVNWNSANDVRKCLTSIFAETRNLHFEVIVVDSASFDSCGEMIKREFSQVRFLQCNENVGFGKANNLGSEIAHGTYVLFLNPDTEITGDALVLMVGAFESLPYIGCLGCRLLNSDRTTQTSCIQAFPTITNQLLDTDFLRRCFPRARIWGMRALLDMVSEPVEVEAISGACIMMRRTVFDSIRGFSSDYFMYAEDMDICYKAVLAGFKNYFLSTASVIHHGDASSRKARSNFAAVMTIESLTRYFRKFHGQLYSWVYRIIIIEIAFARLSLLAPLRVRVAFSGEPSPIRMSWGKWYAILRWGCGFERWATPSKRCVNT